MRLVGGGRDKSTLADQEVDRLIRLGDPRRGEEDPLSLEGQALKDDDPGRLAPRRVVDDAEEDGLVLQLLPVALIAHHRTR